MSRIALWLLVFVSPLWAVSRINLFEEGGHTWVVLHRKEGRWTFCEHTHLKEISCKVLVSDRTLKRPLFGHYLEEEHGTLFQLKSLFQATKGLSSAIGREGKHRLTISESQLSRECRFFIDHPEWQLQCSPSKQLPQLAWNPKNRYLDKELMFTAEGVRDFLDDQGFCAAESIDVVFPERIKSYNSRQLIEIYDRNTGRPIYFIRLCTRWSELCVLKALASHKQVVGYNQRAMEKPQVPKMHVPLQVCAIAGRSGWAFCAIFEHAKGLSLAKHLQDYLRGHLLDADFARASYLAGKGWAHFYRYFTTKFGSLAHGDPNIDNILINLQSEEASIVDLFSIYRGLIRSNRANNDFMTSIPLAYEYFFAKRWVQSDRYRQAAKIFQAEYVRGYLEHIGLRDRIGAVKRIDAIFQQLSAKYPKLF